MHPDPWRIPTFDKALREAESCAVNEYIAFQRAADMVAGYINLNTGKYKP